MEVRQRPLLALGLRLAAALAFSGMLLCVKLVGMRGVSLVETMFWRQAIPSMLVLAFVLARRRIDLLHTSRFGAHARRAAFGVTGMFMTLGVVLILPLAEATVLSFTTPLFAVILAAILLKEKVGAFRWSAVLAGLAGVVVIAGSDRANLPPLGLAVGIGAAFMVALISIQVRDLGRTEQPLTVVFWFSTLCVPALAIPAWWLATPHDTATWALLAATGLTGTLGQLGLTAALRLGNVSSVIVMDYSSIFWATLWGWLVFDHLPPATTWLGAPLIVAAGLIIVWREHRLQVEKPAGALGG